MTALQAGIEIKMKKAEPKEKTVNSAHWSTEAEAQQQQQQQHPDAAQQPTPAAAKCYGGIWLMYRSESWTGPTEMSNNHNALLSEQTHLAH